MARIYEVLPSQSPIQLLPMPLRRSKRNLLTCTGGPIQDPIWKTWHAAGLFSGFTSPSPKHPETVQGERWLACAEKKSWKTRSLSLKPFSLDKFGSKWTWPEIRNRCHVGVCLFVSEPMVLLVEASASGLGCISYARKCRAWLCFLKGTVGYCSSQLATTYKHDANTSLRYRNYISTFQNQSVPKNTTRQPMFR